MSMMVVAFSCNKSTIVDSGGGGIDFLSDSIIVADGNSLTSGYGATSAYYSYPSQLQALSPLSTNGAVIYNAGISGQTTRMMNGEADNGTVGSITDVTSKYDAAKTCILIANEVGNEIFYHGSARAAVDKFWEYCDGRRAEGWTVVIWTCAARSNNSPFGDNPAQYMVKLNQANDYMRAEWASHADALCDVGADSRFTDPTNTTYFNLDQVHFTDAGYAAVAALIKDTLLTLN